MLSELLHTRLVTKDRALCTFAGGVDGKDGQSPTLLTKHMDAKLINRGGLTCAWHTTDAHAHRVAAIGQALVNHFLRTGLMIGINTLDESHGL